MAKAKGEDIVENCVEISLDLLAVCGIITIIIAANIWHTLATFQVSKPRKK